MLAQRPEGARLAEAAAAAGVALSSSQSAARLLQSRGVVEVIGRGRPRYRIREGRPTAEALVHFAARSLDPRHAIELVLRASPAVEFAARDEQGLVIVRPAFAEPSHLLALERALSLIRSGRESELPITTFDHDVLRDRLVDDPAPRNRARRAEIIKGRVERSFPDRRPRARRGRALGRVHPDAPRLSRRRLNALARDHGLRRIALFGSVVRTDFRRDSDIDVLVEPRPDSELTLLKLIGIEHEMERLLDRDVDVVTPAGLRGDMRARIEREAVPILE